MECLKVISSCFSCNKSGKQNHDYDDHNHHDHQNGGYANGNANPQRPRGNYRSGVAVSASAQGAHERQPLLRNTNGLALGVGVDVDNNNPYDYENYAYGGLGNSTYSGTLGKSRLSRSILSDKYSFKESHQHLNNFGRRKVRFVSDEEEPTSAEALSRDDQYEYQSETERLLNRIVDETASKMIDVHGHSGSSHLSRNEANQRSRLYAEIVRSLPTNLIPSLRYGVQKFVSKHPGFENGYVVKVGEECTSQEDKEMMIEATCELEKIVGAFEVSAAEYEDFVVDFAASGSGSKPTSTTNHDYDYDIIECEHEREREPVTVWQ